jgi:hypothetical protein
MERRRPAAGLAPCLTDKPGWDSYGGALLLAAHDEHPELPPPARVSADWPSGRSSTGCR